MRAITADQETTTETAIDGDPAATITESTLESQTSTGQPLSDADLISTWSLMIEALALTSQRLSDSLEAAGVAAPFFDVLVRLVREPSQRLPMTKLATEVSLTSGGFTKLADRMEQDGLLYRQHSAQDRRVIYAVLTDHGRTVADRILPLHIGDLRHNLEDVLGSDRIRELASICRDLRDVHAR